MIVIQEKELEGSLKPKCDELNRMKDALHGALQRRLDVLRLSKQMHEQISVVSKHLILIAYVFLHLFHNELLFC